MNYWEETDETEHYTARDSRRFLEHFLPIMLSRLREIPIDGIPTMWSTGTSMESPWDPT